MKTLNQTHKSEDQVQLLLHRGSRKHRTPSGHFVEDAANTPGGKQTVRGASGPEGEGPPAGRRNQALGDQIRGRYVAAEKVKHLISLLKAPNEQQVNAGDTTHR